VFRVLEYYFLVSLMLYITDYLLELGFIRVSWFWFIFFNCYLRLLLQIENLSAMIAGVSSNDPVAQLEATIEFRTILSKGNCQWFVSICCFLTCCVVFLLCVNVLAIFALEGNPPIEEVVQSGVVPRFVEFLVREDTPQLQVPNGWIFIVF
jgi:hypothetical protein